MLYVDKIALFIGYTFIYFSFAFVFLWSFILLVKLGNKVQHEVLDHFGGWKTFMEYLDWLKSR